MTHVLRQPLDTAPSDAPIDNAGWCHEWQLTSPRRRVAVMRRLREAIVAEARPLAAELAAVRRRPVAECLSSEILPLVDAIRFLERRLPRLLAPRRLGRTGRPAWLTGADLTLFREPLGTVLVIAPSNYPLLLPGTHVLQALAAGNIVQVKPAPGCASLMQRLYALLRRAGLPPDALAVLSTDVAAAAAAIPAVDHVVFTGSHATGQRVLASAGRHGVPVTPEMSGHDPVFVLPGADLTLVARALRFGLTFNDSATCIAPRRVFVPATLLGALETEVVEAMSDLSPLRASASTVHRLQELAVDAVDRGGRVLAGEVPPADATAISPVVLTDVPTSARVLREEAFSPLLAVVPVESVDHALQVAGICPFALGASIFGPSAEAGAVAARINAGCVVVNDLIAPTADPRLPFGGRGHSGYGVTRGAEGLLAMTRIKAVVVRHGTFRPHFDPPRRGDEAMFLHYLQVAHGRSPLRRLKAAFALIKSLASRSKDATE